MQRIKTVRAVAQRLVRTRRDRGREVLIQTTLRRRSRVGLTRCRFPFIDPGLPSAFGEPGAGNLRLICHAFLGALHESAEPRCGLHRLLAIALPPQEIDHRATQRGTPRVIGLLGARARRIQTQDLALLGRPDTLLRNVRGQVRRIATSQHNGAQWASVQLGHRKRNHLYTPDVSGLETRSLQRCSQPSRKTGTRERLPIGGLRDVPIQNSRVQCARPPAAVKRCRIQCNFLTQTQQLKKGYGIVSE